MACGELKTNGFYLFSCSVILSRKKAFLELLVSHHKSNELLGTISIDLRVEMALTMTLKH